MTSFAQQAIDFVAQHGFWMGPLAFALCFAASLLGPNFLVPAGTIMVSIGTLAGSQLISWTVCFWASAGAAVGSAISYGLGVWFGPAILRSRPLRNRQRLVEAAHDLFKSYGFAAVFVGYFSGPLRAVVVASAGVAGMGAIRFNAINVIAALVWGPVFCAQGAAFGTLVDRDQPIVLLMPIAAPVTVTVVSVLAAIVWRQWKVSKRKISS